MPCGAPSDSVKGGATLLRHLRATRAHPLLVPAPEQSGRSLRCRFGVSALFGHRYATVWTKHECVRLARSPLYLRWLPFQARRLTPPEGANLGHLWVQSDLPQSPLPTRCLRIPSRDPAAIAKCAHLAKGYPIFRLRPISSAPNKRSPGGCDVARRRANQGSNFSGGAT